MPTPAVLLLERAASLVRPGSVAGPLVAELRARGARVDVCSPDDEAVRLDALGAPDVVILKSGSAAALHLAAALERRGARCVNDVEATRVAQDRLAWAGVLQSAGLPVARSWTGSPGALRALADEPCRLVVKELRGSNGSGVHVVEPGALGALLDALPPDGALLAMVHAGQRGDDLKVFVAGDHVEAIERPFPARTLDEKRGRPVELDHALDALVREVGELLGLSCFGCDLVGGADGHVLVDVNAFPGYKGARAAVPALADVVLAAAAAAAR